MNEYKKQFEKMASAQRDFFEPMVKINEFAVNAYEKVARHNYEVAGDFVDFTIDQARAAAAVDSVNGLMKLQVSGAQDFADLVGKRASEYMVMTRDMFTECQYAVKTNIVEPAQRASEKYDEAAKEFQDEVKDSFEAVSAAANKSSRM